MSDSFFGSFNSPPSISGFTAYSKTVSAFKVVQLVTKLFSAIDDLSRRVGIYKVCTIGDCYVATLEPESHEMSDKEQILNRRQGCGDMFKFAAGLVYLVTELRSELMIDTLNQGCHGCNVFCQMTGPNEMAGRRID